MIEFLQFILEDSEKKIKKYRHNLEEFEKDPMVLMKGIFTGEDMLLPLIVQQYSEEILLEMQMYLYNHFLPAFRDYLDVEGIVLTYDEKIFPAPIQIDYREEPLALINIVTKEYEALETLSVVQMQREVKELEQLIKETEQELENWDPALKNPLVLGGANPIKLLDITLRRKKYKAMIRSQIAILQNDLFDFDQRRLHLLNAIEAERRENIDRALCLERIEYKLKFLPGFEHLKEREEHMQEDEE